MLQFNHFNSNVLDLEQSLAFYRQVLKSEVAEEKEVGDGSFELVHLGDGETGFRLELTWLRDRTEPYDLGEQEFHLAFVTDRFDALSARHRTMGYVCFENPDMGVYFTEDPDGYWIEFVPEWGQGVSQTIGGQLTYAGLPRCTAMLAVIVVHITGGALEVSSTGMPDSMVFNVYSGLAHRCVPVFVMLSGMLLLDPKHSLPPSKLFFGHVLHITAALAVWGTAYVLVERVQVHDLSWESVRVAFYQVLLGKTCFHLWFLYMLLGLYLVTPMLRVFARGAGRGDSHWSFLLVLVFIPLLPILLCLWPSQMVSLYQSYLNTKLVLGYVGYYVLGYYLKEYTLSRLAEHLIYLLRIVGAAAIVGGTAWLSQQRGALARTSCNYDSPNIALMNTVASVLLRYLLGVSDKRFRRQRFSGVAKAFFGIYLVYVFSLMLLRNFGTTALSSPPVPSVPVLMVAVFLTSLTAVWLLSRVPFVGKHLT